MAVGTWARTIFDWHLRAIRIGSAASHVERLDCQWAGEVRVGARVVGPRRVSGEVIDELAGIGLPHLSHNLLQALEVLVPVDPRGVFLRVARVIRGGRKGGYQYDPMAEAVIIRIVDRYLADHRELFQTNAEVRERLIEVLDTFVNAGSEGAGRLSYGLDGIFR